MNWHFLQAELLRAKQAGVTGNNDIVLIDDNRLAPAELSDRGRDLVDRLLRDLPSVPHTEQSVE